MNLTNVVVEVDHRLCCFAQFGFDLAHFHGRSRACICFHSFNVLLIPRSATCIRNVFQIGADIDKSLYPKRHNSILILHIQSALLDIMTRHSINMNTSSAGIIIFADSRPIRFWNSAPVSNFFFRDIVRAEIKNRSKLMSRNRRCRTQQ